MANNDPNNEEYKLDDLDLLASEPEDELHPEESGDALSAKDTATIHEDAQPWENPIFRKGLIVVGGLILFLLFYKAVHLLLGGKSTENQIVPVTQQTQKQSVPLQQPMPTLTTTTDHATTEKLTSLEQAQNNAQATLQNLNEEVSSLNASMSDISSKIGALSSTLASLSDRLDAQTHEIERLVAMNTKRIHPVHVSRAGASKQVVMYSLQAIIPGRAWLVASDGSSITVREGSTIPGYGVVKGIDPARGRVLMSSGRVIRFSQVDS